MELIEKAAGQGHAYAMAALGDIHRMRGEQEQELQWITKAGGVSRTSTQSTN